MTNKTAQVVIPTVNGPFLPEAILSVWSQSYPSVLPHLFVDGPVTIEMPERLPLVLNTTLTTRLAENVGKAGGNFYGHRVFAASPHLVNADYVFFLDEDNLYERDHVASLIDLCETYNLEFAFSHRKIIDREGSFKIEDSCESLGTVPIWVDNQSFLVDTSSYCFRRDFLIQCSYLWHYGWGGDRRFFNIVRNMQINSNGSPRKIRYGTTGHTSLSYRLDGNPNSVTSDFFVQGNTSMQALYPTKYPFRTQEIIT